MSNPFEHSISYTDLNTSSELRELHSVDYMLHLQDGVHTYVPEPLTAPQLVVPHGQRGSMLTHAHDAPWWVASANRQIQIQTGKGGRSNRLTQTDNHMHHTSIRIVILGKHIATMLRHNPYSLLRSTARTNLVERSYPKFLFYYHIIFFIYIYIFFNLLFFKKNLFYRLVSLSRVSLCVSFPLFHFEPLNQTLNPGPEIEIDFRQ